ncbi:quinoprotein dehydrogenase-associated SoxYZ-like carrier [Rivihabitans pingtungensis]|uniref:quinoprotein dehydrogenase-associated SoxYZ-like carrier n=1 Tax=Rivihabitans pingtungensis TaxID=1054498 RepID=UPI002FDB2924
MQWLRLICLAALCSALPTWAAPAGDPFNSPLWPNMHKLMLGGGKVVFDPKVKVTIPERVEDGHFVPVTVDARELGEVRELVLFADYNPIPRALRYQPLAAQPRLSVAMRVNQATPIRAAALDGKGVWHVSGQWLDAPGGGCALPSQTRSSTDWNSLLGRVSGRAWREDGALRVRLGVMHPMDTGLVSNVARFNIEQLDIRDADNRLLARLETDASLAENPLFTLHLRPTPTPLLRASSQDNDGNHYTATLPLAP